ncbi:kinase-like domain-containing protein [Apiosordaria backusii]|uniref:non-specific serine/threonine protein kinase n=1 Tax=Apiosordaria backusii TaxID=314023 RepID=A0AA40BLZ9_9PEZI|nr:kinase-like domain-containing protein [Apiosordaria backusii]
MATLTPTPPRRRRGESFRIHEDVPSTEDTEMNEHDFHDEEADDREAEHDVEQVEEQEQEEQESEYTESSDDDITVDRDIQYDMDKLQDSFPGFRSKYRLIKRIGEGTFSTVYKAEDLAYDRYDNSWDFDRDSDKWTPPPLKSFSSGDHHQTVRRRKPKYVAIKKIYVTSSPTRILNELELLHDLRDCENVCPLITAFRATDQVVAILPYFRHADFREYFRNMTVHDISIYLRSLFTALASVHRHHILHRDIKPTNFLYDPETRRGVLVDFGLAEREGSECKPCLCHDDYQTRKARLANHNTKATVGGYPKQDTRPSRRANRAGTRGFRAPEVLFKCTEQTTKIDIWSVGVILLTILSKRFPFFNSADDVEAMIEIATIFGREKMKEAGKLHGCAFETTIPTIGSGGFSFERIILWSTCRSDSEKTLPADEKMAVEFLKRCLDLDPRHRISAEEALEHDFLQYGMGSSVEGPGDNADDDEMDILKV